MIFGSLMILSRSDILRVEDHSILMNPWLLTLPGVVAGSDIYKAGTY